MVYTSQVLSLAVLELLVHVDSDLLPGDLVAIPAELPADISRRSIDPRELPSGWRRWPSPPALRAIGRDWLRSGTSAVLTAPSAVVPQEHNLLLNPAHPDFHRVRIGEPQPFSLDPRLRA